MGEGCGREQNHGRHGSVGCAEKVGSWGVRVGQEERTITEMWWENKRLSRGSWISESLSRSGWNTGVPWIPFRPPEFRSQPHCSELRGGVIGALYLDSRTGSTKARGHEGSVSLLQCQFWLYQFRCLPSPSRPPGPSHQRYRGLSVHQILKARWEVIVPNLTLLRKVQKEKE